MWRRNYWREGDEFRAFPQGLSVLNWVFSTAILNHAFTNYCALHARRGESQAETTRSAHESVRQPATGVRSPVVPRTQKGAYV